MSKQIDLACTMCTEEFLVPSGVYIAHYGALACRCCGSSCSCRRCGTGGGCRCCSCRLVRLQQLLLQHLLLQVLQVG